MDIINYTEVDKLEEHLINRRIQEALLDSDTIEWALNYDKKNLGRNLAIAYGLPVSEWEQYKDLEDLENMTGTPGGSGNAFVILGRASLRLAELFYDKILPQAKVYTSTWNTGGIHYEKFIQAGGTTLLKANLRSHVGHGKFGFRTKTEGNYVDTDLYNGNSDVAFDIKIVNKYNNLTIYRNTNGCENSYQYTVWYI